MRVRGISLITAFTVTMAACSGVETNPPAAAHQPTAPGDTIAAGFEPAFRWPPTGLVPGSPADLTTASLTGLAAVAPAAGGRRAPAGPCRPQSDHNPNKNTN
ncbi:hypothetical protein ACFWY5_55065, partial [Nonomuraea sp. NPDC059007]|uniref:hypothetical protein n=1 Tax=Nonomuraea sp. NPDC059007 TaxID=3346692 RepID=UPI0036AEA55C